MMENTKILIVEDDIMIAMALSRHLKNLGYAVCPFALTAQDALKTAERDRPDLVLMDIHLGTQSRIDGIEAATMIRDRFHIPVAFTTASIDQDAKSLAQAAMPAGFLTKPINYKVLHWTIESALRQYHEQHAASNISTGGHKSS